MKKLFFLLLFVLYYISTFSQNLDSTELKIITGSKIIELNELFKSEEIDYFKLESKDIKLRNYFFQFSIKEFFDKKLVRNDSLLKDYDFDKSKTGYSNTDTNFIITLMKRNVNRDTSLFIFSFQNTGLRTFIYDKKIPYENYSTRDFLMSYEELVNVPIEKTFPLFVYTLPYENPKYPGFKFYCELSKNGVPPEKWMDVYGVRHLMIIYLTIRKK